MNEPVILKGFGKGIAAILDKEIDFDILCGYFKNKVVNAKNFFSGTEVPIIFLGRSLNSEELFRLIDIMKTFGGVHDIIFPWDDINFYDLVPKTLTEKNKINDSGYVATKIHRGTLRAGQIIKEDGDIVVFGDVNPGAEVIAGNNIFVLGTLRGIAHAGFYGNKDTIVFALKLKPVQIRIADMIARAPDEDNFDDVINPEIAFIEDNTIVIKSINQFKV